MYEFVFELTDSDEAGAKALTALYRWLREDAMMRGEVSISLAEETHPEAMGAVEVVSVVLTQLTAVGSLAVSFATWRDSRAGIPQVRIRSGKASIDEGVSEVTAEQLEAALRMLAEAGAHVTVDADKAEGKDLEA